MQTSSELPWRDKAEIRPFFAECRLRGSEIASSRSKRFGKKCIIFLLNSTAIFGPFVFALEVSESIAKLDRFMMLLNGVGLRYTKEHFLFDGYVLFCEALLGMVGITSNIIWQKS